MSHDSERRNKAKDILSKAGYGKVKNLVEKDVSEGIHEHESRMHGSAKKSRLKFASGGHVDGESAKCRLDKKSRGGKNKNHHDVKINIISAGQKPTPVPVPVPAGGNSPPPAMPARPPMPMQGAQMPPQAGMPAPQGMPMRKSGGRLKRAAGGSVRNKMDAPHLEGGSGGGLGRLEKADHEEKRKKVK